MTLEDALTQTGCAIFTDEQCTTSVERLSDSTFLLMTRRGICILQCLIVPLSTILKRYEQQRWEPSQVAFVRGVRGISAPVAFTKETP